MAARREATRRFPPMPAYDAFCQWAKDEGGHAELEADPKTGLTCLAADVPTIPGGISRYVQKDESFDRCAEIMLKAIQRG